MTKSAKRTAIDVGNFNAANLPHPKRLASIVRNVKACIEGDGGQAKDSSVRKGVAKGYGTGDYGSLLAISEQVHAGKNVAVKQISAAAEGDTEGIYADALKALEGIVSYCDDNHVIIASPAHMEKYRAIVAKARGGATEAASAPEKAFNLEDVYLLLDQSNGVLALLTEMLNDACGNTWWNDGAVTLRLLALLRMEWTSPVVDEIQDALGDVKHGEELWGNFYANMRKVMALLDRSVKSDSIAITEIRDAYTSLNMAHYELIAATVGLGQRTFECQNCGWMTNDENHLNEIEDLNQRVSSGDVMPAGECPVCGSLCQEIGKDDRRIMEDEAQQRIMARRMAGSNTPQMCNRVRAAAAKILKAVHPISILAYFDQGHWWVTDIRTDLHYRVIENGQGAGVDGLSLEMLTDVE